MKRAASAALNVDVLVDSKNWKNAAVKSIVRRAVVQAAAMLSAPPAELAIVLTDDSKMRALNRTWRGVDAPTNVLSFPAIRNGVQHASKQRLGGRHLGDIVLAYETVRREARHEHKSLADHLAHLAVHGFLHLLGYDHESDKDARKMEGVERAILRQLAIPDPYRFKSSSRGAAANLTSRAKRIAKQASRGRARTAQNA
jgi:probable rRNA maturation factor